MMLLVFGILLVTASAAGAGLAGPVPASHGLLVPVMHLLAQGHPDMIRPGVWITQPHDCTMAFVLRDAAGDLYGTTAGYCVDRVGQVVEVKGHGRVGRVVAFANAGLGEDFALFSFDEAVRDRVSPTMAGWSGPNGVFAGSATGAVVIRHYGYGAATWMNHDTRCRSAVGVADTWAESHYNQDGVLVWGDSGSPSITADGRALGINTHLAAPPRPGTSFGTRLDFAMAALEGMTGLDLALVEGEPAREACG